MENESSPRIGQARTVGGDELKSLIHDVSEEALLALLENPHLDEPHVTQLLERLDLPANLLGAIAAQKKWTGSEAIRVRLARHPRTPRRIAMTLLKQLFLFDLVRLSLSPQAPAEIRRLAEEIIITRMPNLALGEKLTLARRGPSRVAGAILAEGHAQATKLALNNGFLTESQVLKVLAKAGAPERVVSAIAQHPKWSIQYNVRVALLRNAHTPVPCVLAFLPNMTARDLKELSQVERVSTHFKKYIQQELARRAQGAGVRSK